jgi:FHA domain
VFTLLYNDSGKPHRHVLAQGTTTVGRAPGNDLILHHGSVSRRHAVIEVDRGSCRTRHPAHGRHPAQARRHPRPQGHARSGDGQGHERSWGRRSLVSYAFEPIPQLRENLASGR